MLFFRYYVFVLGISVCGMACADESPAQETSAQNATTKQSVAEIIPITEKNLRGHQSLYREGWFVVSSTEKAFNYAKEHSITSSGQAMSQAVAGTGRHSTEFGKNLKEAGKGGVQTGAEIFKGGTELSKKELALTSILVKTEWDYGSSKLNSAWEHFVKGNMTLTQRTAEDRQALSAVPGDWYKHLQNDFSNLDELTDKAKASISTHIEGRWGDAFGEARADFNRSYVQSGTRGNSLSGLFDIIAGHIKALYSGVVKPASRTVVQGAEATTKGVTNFVFLPVTKLFVVSGRTIQSTGLSLYYTTSMGVKLVSPTVEGGLLTGLSMLSYSAIPVTAAIGGAVGAVNQVAVTAATPVIGAGKTVAVGAADTGMYAAQVSYDLIKGVTKVTMNQARSGIVLGYNALTALPTQILLGAMDGVVFLAYDGPRLVVASVKGEVQWSDKSGEKGNLPVQSLPVGSVVDLNALSKQPGVQTQIISDDPEVVQRVLEKLPDDLREEGRP
ncbi:MAG: hypothetical protein ABL860_08865 [Candidatus Nitrotoga sp.]